MSKYAPMKAIIFSFLYCRRFSSPSFLSFRHFSSSNDEFTHILVGGGSAGCVLANRLSSKSSNNVLLLEAGKLKKNIIDYCKIYMPAALTYNLMDDKYNWYYFTEPQKEMNNRCLYHPRGKVLGGGSSLNAMVYIRGHAYDYDRWEFSEGCAGWNYASCLPYFKKSETYENGNSIYRGNAGPLHVVKGKCENILYDAFINAGVEYGYEKVEDFNGYKQVGFGKYQMTIKNGMRCNTYASHLAPALSHRNNLTVLTGALVSRILIEGDKAVGVEIVNQDKNREVFRICDSGDICLSGGAFNTPQILQLSGIGNENLLKQFDIPVVKHLPGVGQNLQDHLEFYAQWSCRKNVTLSDSLRLWKMCLIGMEWLLFKTGLGASSHLECGAFTKTHSNVLHPDIQWHFLPGLIENHGRAAGSFHAYQVHIGTLRPKSRGFVNIQSKAPFKHPIIQPNYLSYQEDIDDLLICIDQARDVMNQSVFNEFKGTEIKPGLNVKTKEEKIEFIRNNCETAYHPSCTCKMGPSDDPMAVVDPITLNVWGFQNLKIVDASIMPSIISGNLNGPVIMMAEKASDKLLGVSPLTPLIDVPVYENDLKKQNKNE